jgi:hypothetical protein
MSNNDGRIHLTSLSISRRIEELIEKPGPAEDDMILVWRIAVGSDL